MTKKQQLALLRFVTFCVVLLLAALGLVDLDSLNPTALRRPASPSGSVAPNPASAAWHPVISVTDGDTFRVNLNGKTETVRLVGINTPETVDPRKPVECFGQQASDALKQLLSGQTVRLETDPTQSERDRYGRLLRFAFLPDGTDIGLWLLENGYAQESLYSDVPHRYREKYLQAQQQAEEEHRGLWDPETCSNYN